MKNEKEIYILLTDTGTVFTRMIRLFTRRQLNHASIAFDAELKEIYSFGRRNPNNPFTGGFVKENLRGQLFQSASCALYKCTVSKKVYERLRRHVQNFENNPGQYKYNLLGLFGILFKMKIERKNAYFCSQFVATVCANNGLHLVSKPPAITTPADFEDSDLLQLIYAGRLFDHLIATPSSEAI